MLIVGRDRNDIQPKLSEKICVFFYFVLNYRGVSSSKLKPNTRRKTCSANYKKKRKKKKINDGYICVSVAQLKVFQIATKNKYTR